MAPIAYEVTDDPPPAADYLRDLAARLIDAPYDGQTGEYAYHHLRTWGYSQLGSEEGHVASYVREQEQWVGPGGTGSSRVTEVGVEFPDEESRRYFEAHPQPGMFDYPRTTVYPYSHAEDVVAYEYVAPGEPIPTDPQQRLDQMIGVDIDGVPHFGIVELLYERYLVPRDFRAAVLEAIAEVPGVVWRGEVTDRAGRSGVAVTYNGAGDAGIAVRHVLVFDPQTGELLSCEQVNLEPHMLDGPEGPVEISWVDTYVVFLEAGWTGDPGLEPTVPSTTPSPGPSASTSISPLPEPSPSAGVSPSPEPSPSPSSGS